MTILRWVAMLTLGTSVFDSMFHDGKNEGRKHGEPGEEARLMP
ncbi:hypothetical protein [Burkholderia gladioli]|nr:hypothetical protein [Burkholderia gladioli]